MSDEDVVLARGAHPDPAAGRCLMEHVATSAGEPFGVLPPCTHPVLAALAGAVNDRVSDGARSTLVRRAPLLGRAHSRDPGLTWRFVGHAATAVLVRRPEDPAALRRVRRAARARRTHDALAPLARRVPRWVTTAAALAALDELVAAFHALLAVAGPAGSAARDRALLDLLDLAVETTVGGPALPVGSPAEEVPAA